MQVAQIKDLNNSSNSSLLRVPKAVIVDWDNTLVDSKEAYQVAFKKLCDQYRIRLDGKQIALRFIEEMKQGKSVGTIRREILQENWIDSEVIHQKLNTTNVEEIIRKVEEDWNQLLNEQSTPFMKGAKNFLSLLVKNKIPTVILSGGRSEKYLKENSFYNDNIDQSIQACGEVEGEENNKPSINSLKRALKNINIDLSTLPCENIWVIGDGYSEIYAAIDAQMTPIRIGQHKPEDFIEKYNGSIVYYCEDLEKLTSFLNLKFS